MSNNIINIESEILDYLDNNHIPYSIKGYTAKLIEHDSLTIQLSGKYKDSWKRWSTNDFGFGVKSLDNYLKKIGDIEKSVVSTNNKSKKRQIKQPKPVDYNRLIYNPNPEKLIKYMSQKRKIDKAILKQLLSQKLITEDPNGFVRFHLRNKDLKTVGTEIKGDIEKNGELEKVSYIARGSKGFFFLNTKDLVELSDAKNIIFFEAAIDLISYIELVSINLKNKKDIFYQLPQFKPNTLFISLSGASTKVENAISFLSDLNINFKDCNIYSACDEDSAGYLVKDKLQEILKQEILEERVNGGSLNSGTKIKDWNELLVKLKEDF